MEFCLDWLQIVGPGGEERLGRRGSRVGDSISTSNRPIVAAKPPLLRH
jgi:hypothetical protein